MRSRRGHAHLSATHARRSHADPTPCLGAAQRAPTRPTRHARACTHALERAMRTRSNVSHIAASHTHTPHPQAQKPKAPKQRSVTFFIMMLAEFFWRTNEDSTTAKPACIMMLPRAAQGARVSARCARAWSLSLSLSLPLSLARAHTYAHTYPVPVKATAALSVHTRVAREKVRRRASPAVTQDEIQDARAGTGGARTF